MTTTDGMNRIQYLVDSFIELQDGEESTKQELINGIATLVAEARRDECKRTAEEIRLSLHYMDSSEDAAWLNMKINKVLADRLSSVEREER